MPKRDWGSSTHFTGDYSHTGDDELQKPQSAQTRELYSAS